ncbi:MAG TPA: DegT/DnrJ/EryC1/StrS family aminotransferase [Propionibacteriaceae bacterium]|nr:DegT/DnrJ/EryC1/StrS family aminotransferase [Propionibacteriaceae bacterium]
MYPRHRLDIGAADLWLGIRATARRTSCARAELELLRTAGIEGRGLVCLSVRSAWDLLLGVLDLPAGSEVLVSAITHPGMVTILQEHGLRAVPVDLDPATLAPTVAALEAACTERTRGLLVAHLLGGRVDLAPLLGFARRRGLLLVEDSAQAFTGLSSLAPSGADVSLFSFGLIKTATAAGGAVVTVADPALLARLRAAHDRWPRQRSRSYATKLAKTAALAVFNDPRRFALLQRVSRAAGIDLDGMISSATRSFAAGAAMLTRIRRRPTAGLLALLHRRLCGVDADRVAARAALGEELAAALPAAYRHPGDRLHRRTHWLFPVVAPDPDRLVAELRSRGVDASQGTSNLAAVAGADGKVPPRAGELMAHIVYLPCYPELGPDGRDRILAALRAAAGELLRA